MRIALTAVAIASAALLSACASVEYRDTNAAVDANPQCALTEKPGELPAPWCKREQSANWELGGKDTPVDFTGGDGDGD